MPKLDGTHIHERLRQRLEQLRNGEEVARRELETLLTKQQIEAWDAAWDEQKRLPKSKRARTKKGEAAFGRKSKQLGNSVAMIERYYSKLTATMAAERLA